jgi:hypothetical protein
MPMPAKPYSGRVQSVFDLTPRDLILNQISGAAYIGAIAIEWSRIEALLSFLFGLLLFRSAEAKDAIGMAVAVESFELARSFGIKRNLLLAATKKRVGSKTRKEFSDLLHDLAEARTSRDEVVHGRWSFTEAKPYKLVRLPRMASDEKPLLYEPEDLLEILEKLQEQEIRLLTFFNQKVSPSLKSTLELFGELITRKKGDDTKQA